MHSRSILPLAVWCAVLFLLPWGGIKSSAAAQSPGNSAAAKLQDALQGQKEAENTAKQANSFTACLKLIKGSPELRLPGSLNYRDYANGLRIIRWHTPAAVIYPKTVRQVQV